jgi:hypothetical protein
VVDGKPVRTPVPTGLSDGAWVEVTRRLVQSPGASEGKWVPFDGSEAVIPGDLSELSDGAPVRRAGGAAARGERVSVPRLDRHRCW